MPVDEITNDSNEGKALLWWPCINDALVLPRLTCLTDSRIPDWPAVRSWCRVVGGHLWLLLRSDRDIGGHPLLPSDLLPDPIKKEKHLVHITRNKRATRAHQCPFSRPNQASSISLQVQAVRTRLPPVPPRGRPPAGGRHTFRGAQKWTFRPHFQSQNRYRVAPNRIKTEKQKKEATRQRLRRPSAKLTPSRRSALVMVGASVEIGGGRGHGPGWTRELTSARRTGRVVVDHPLSGAANVASLVHGRHADLRPPLAAAVLYEILRFQDGRRLPAEQTRLRTSASLISSSAIHKRNGNHVKAITWLRLI